MSNTSTLTEPKVQKNKQQPISGNGATNSGTTELTTAKRLKAIISGSIGNLVEWYDWYAYSAFSIYFAPVFFPSASGTAQLLNTAGIFAVGFLMRPIGGWLFGSIADKTGRKFAMTLSVILMSLGSLLIALTPSYATIGILAPILLLIARLLQGLSVGGEYGTSATYLSEMATPDKRGFYSSFQYVTLIGGQLIALGIQLIMQKLFFTSEEMHAYGWRIPFFIGAALSLIALYLRAHMEETKAFKSNEKEQVKTDKENKSGSLKELLKYPKQLMIVVGLTAGGTLAFNTYSTYMQKFLVNTSGFTKEDSTLITFSSLLIFALIQPVLGLLSDKIGRKPLLLGFGVLGTISTVPLLNALSHVQAGDIFTAFMIIMAALIVVSGYTSINAVVKAELFPTNIRALGVGFPYSITVAIFGGTSEWIALLFKQNGNESGFYWYVTACIVASLFVYFLMPDTKKTSTFKDEA